MSLQAYESLSDKARRKAFNSDRTTTAKNARGNHSNTQQHRRTIRMILRKPNKKNSSEPSKRF